MTARAKKYLIIFVNRLIMVAIFITLISLFVPFVPSFPGAFLDSSWVFSINQAVAQHLIFGKDLIFTLGPYGAIYTGSYHIATDWLMLAGSFYLALSYFLAISFLIQNAKCLWSILFCVVLAFTGSSYKDILLFLYPVLAGLTVFKIFSEQNTVRKNFFKIFVELLFIFAPFGLLLLIKGSLLILSLSVFLCCALFLFIKKEKYFLFPIFIAPLISICFFWIAAGQKLSDLPAYFFSMVEVISGYTEAMAISGNSHEIWLYLLISFLMLSSVALQKTIPFIVRSFLFSLIACFLFISFKAGFVRHDGHAIAAASAIMIAAMMLPFVINTRIIVWLLLSSFTVGFVIESHYIRITPMVFYHQLQSIYLSAWQGFFRRIQDKNWPRTDFKIAINTLKEQASFPVLPGTTDIYSYDQSFLLASGNTWAPRPVFQSYAVYTPVLAEKNKKHLLQETAPDNIIFKIAPIDGRLPSLEDGASWPILLSNYEPTQSSNNFLFLKRKSVIPSNVPYSKVLLSGPHALGETVSLPNCEGLLFAKLNVKPTLIGQLANFFFKPTPLTIMIHLKNGKTIESRFIAVMGQTEFLLSPFIENTVEFESLYKEEARLEAKKVISFSINASHSDICWDRKYTLTLERIFLPNNV